MASSLTKKKYEESQKVKDAYENYNTYKETEKPDDYSFSDDDILSGIEYELFNPEEFTYNVQADPLYSQYKKTYTAQGKQAMEDSVGNASALTGGYGNSYAQTAGINAYNSYLGKLNDVVPELYAAAYSRYEDELDRLESKLGYLTAKDKEEYSRYLDRYSFYNDEVNSLRDLYLQEYKNDINIQDSEWESAYKIAMAEQERELANAELGYKYYAAQQNQAQFEAEMAYKQAQADLDKRVNAYKLRLEREKLQNEDAQFWAEFNEKNRETLREDELYVLLGNGGEYETVSALDYNYEDDEMVRYKALSMGIDKDFIEAYFEAKYKRS